MAQVRKRRLGTITSKMHDTLLRTYLIRMLASAKKNALPMYVKNSDLGSPVEVMVEVSL
jgi:hypothetical protein